MVKFRTKPKPNKASKQFIIAPREGVSSLPDRKLSPFSYKKKKGVFA